MKTITSILALFVISTSLQAQVFSKKINGNGNIVTETRDISDYNKLSVAGNFDVELVKGKGGEITIKGDENVMDYIITEVKDDKLKIRTKKGYNIKTKKAIKITVPFNKLSAISMAGSGDIFSSDVVNSESLKLSLAGSGDVKLKVSAGTLKASVAGSGDISLQGKADNFSASIAGSGDISGYELEAREARASIAGSGDITINVTEHLNASVAGSGDIHYTGDPKVKSHSIGSGSIEKK